jgi:hypothetical protein
MKRFILFWLLITAAALAFGGQKALLIGNYSYPDGALLQPALDLAKADTTLASAGFTVTKHQNLNKTQMQAAVQQFASTLTGDDFVVFYYSGHGVPYNNRHYLLPADKSITQAATLISNSVELGWVTAQMDSADAVVSFIDYNRRAVDLSSGSKTTTKAPPVAIPYNHAIVTSGTANIFAHYSATKASPSKFTNVLCPNLVQEGLKLEQIMTNVYGVLGISMTAEVLPFTLGSPGMKDVIIRLPAEAEENRAYKSFELDIDGGGSYNF